MKNTKKISLLLAALTVSSALASTVSAGNIFVGRPNDRDEVKCPVCDTVIELDKCDEKKEVTKAETTGSFIWNSSFGGGKTYYKKPVSRLVLNSEQGDEDHPGAIFVEEKTVVKVPVSKVPAKDYGCIIGGGKYYSTAAAKVELAKYFDENSYNMHFSKGDERTFCEGAYFYSTDPDVVYYDYKTGKLVAESIGSADVYVYTAGGVPFFRLDVSVGRKSTTPTLEVVPEDWHLEIGETTTFKVTASDGKVYDDIELSIWKGSDKAKLGGQSGKLTAEENGAVVIHASSKSNKNIYGDALVYIGSYTGAVKEGCWTKCDGGIRVDNWYGDICGNFGKINGWIKSAEGILIPVLKLEDATVYDKDGTSAETTILTMGSVSILDYLKGAYGDKCDVIDIIKKYNLLKDGVSCDKNVFDYADLDIKNIILSQIIKDIIG